MRNLNNAEINAVAGGTEKCSIEVWRNGVPRFSLVMADTVDGQKVTDTDASEIKTLISLFQSKLMKNKNNINLQNTTGTPGQDGYKPGYHLVAVCQNFIDLES
jgi:hypothetical protein